MTYTEGIAFILEGSTEKVFYLNLIKYLASLDVGVLFEKNISDDDGEVFYLWQKKDKAILIKMHVVGTVTQVVHSGRWFENKCAKKHKLPWSVYLCYDTDSPNADVSKFHEDDWERLRNKLNKCKVNQIIDLAASADIEDIMLLDVQGVCNYLGIGVPETIRGRKGKAKMKNLFRSCASTYHEGEKAEAMIQMLDFEKIIREAPIELRGLKEKILKNEMS